MADLVYGIVGNEEYASAKAIRAVLDDLVADANDDVEVWFMVELSEEPSDAKIAVLNWLADGPEGDGSDPYYYEAYGPSGKKNLEGADVAAAAPKLSKAPAKALLDALANVDGEGVAVFLWGEGPNELIDLLEIAAEADLRSVDLTDGGTPLELGLPPEAEGDEEPEPEPEVATAEDDEVYSLAQLKAMEVDALVDLAAAYGIDGNTAVSKLPAVIAEVQSAWCAENNVEDPNAAGAPLTRAELEGLGIRKLRALLRAEGKSGSGKSEEWCIAALLGEDEPTAEAAADPEGLDVDKIDLAVRICLAKALRDLAHSLDA